ncbi:hypothetical protein SAMN04490179_3736 [Pseudomonas antarctica]|uniref:Uncharacterized protein n=1 Tax=Pseudomonas antarctica TaxID=219572 RepID=A0A1H0AKJ0_9PSED|nr:hypothetical protein PSAN_42850 [Pseudomonas antarctica]SDN33851.1 hypothetical protein SAMN04490179_3736 [Pseudomonas antarctica]
MGFLLCLFKRHAHVRNYALMDSNGTCIGFIQCDHNPGSQWVQVEEISLARLTKARTGTSGSNTEPSKERD